MMWLLSKKQNFNEKIPNKLLSRLSRNTPAHAFYNSMKANPPFLVNLCRYYKNYQQRN